MKRGDLVLTRGHTVAGYADINELTRFEWVPEGATGVYLEHRNIAGVTTDIHVVRILFAAGPLWINSKWIVPLDDDASEIHNRSSQSTQEIK